MSINNDLSSFCLSGISKEIENCIRLGADPNFETFGQSVLYKSCVMNNPEGIKQLIQAGAKVDFIFPETGDTPLMISCIRNNQENVKVLLEAGANPNIQDLDGQTALHYACQKNNIQLVKDLLNAGADRNLKNRSGRTALEVAEAFNNTNVVEVLKTQPVSQLFERELQKDDLDRELEDQQEVPITEWWDQQTPLAHEISIPSKSSFSFVAKTAGALFTIGSLAALYWYFDPAMPTAIAEGRSSFLNVTNASMDSVKDFCVNTALTVYTPIAQTLSENSTVIVPVREATQVVAKGMFSFISDFFDCMKEEQNILSCGYKVIKSLVSG